MNLHLSPQIYLLNHRSQKWEAEIWRESYTARRNFSHESWKVPPGEQMIYMTADIVMVVEMAADVVEVVEVVEMVGRG